MLPLALKIKYGVDHVLEHLRPCDRALLIHVSDEQNGNTLVFRDIYEFHRGILYLRDASGR